MSNFFCEYCGVEIIEDNFGHYITGCPHYPISFYNQSKTHLNDLFSKVTEEKDDNSKDS